MAFTYAKDIKDYRVDRVVEPPDEAETDQPVMHQAELAVAREA